MTRFIDRIADFYWMRDAAYRHAEWKERDADRRHLRGLDDHVLCDMGLKRVAVEREARKPFWRPLDFK